MNERIATVQKAAPSPAALATGGLLQRKCACGNNTMAGSECEECGKKKLQRKLSIGASDDPLELEADRVADQVLATPAHSEVRGVAPYVQRFTGQLTGDAGIAPASVDRVLASSGRPLDLTIEREMGRRFDYDFSQVRVHTGREAERSASDVNAHAYTVGQDIVFGAGQFAPESHAGRKLIAHELTHVVQSGKESTEINRQTIYRQADHAQIEAEIKILRTQLMAPVNPLRPVQEARLIQLEAMLNRTDRGANQPSPPKPKVYLDMPFTFRFSKAWVQAKVIAQRKIHKVDEAYHDSSITRGLMEVKDLAPSADEVWKTGIYGGLFKNDENDLVKEWSGQMASQSYRKRYEAARYGNVHGDERYYESSSRRRDDDSEIWSRGREYGLFLSSEKAAVLKISTIGMGRALALNAMARTVDPKSPEAAKLIDEIHNFTKDEAVVLLGPEIERLLGQYGYKYRDEAYQPSVADAINKAYEKSLQPNQVLKDPGATVVQRWDECQWRRGVGKNNLEAAKFDPNCFQSEDEFKTEFARREDKYRHLYRDCGHSRPSHFECRNRVAAEYRPGWATWRDRQQRQAYAQIQKIDDIVNSGAGATGGRLVGYLAGRILGHDEKESLNWSERGAAIGGIGDTVLGIKAGMTARASSQSYNGGGGLVVSRDAPVTQTVTSPSAADPAEDDPWAGSVPRPVDVTGGKAYPPAPEPAAATKRSQANAPPRAPEPDAIGTSEGTSAKTPPPATGGTRPAAGTQQATQRMRINLAYVNSVGELTVDGIKFLRDRYPEKFKGLNDKQVASTFESDIKGTMWEKMVLDEIAQTVPTPPRGAAGRGQPFLMKNRSLTNMVSELEKKVPGSIRDRAPLGQTVRQVINSSPELKKAEAALEKNPNAAVRNEWVDWMEKNQNSLIGDKKPDAVEVIPGRNLAVVYDPTLTVNSPFGPVHAFKTALYREVLIRVTGMDIGAIDVGRGIFNLVGE